MTPADFLLAARTVSWKLTPELAHLLDDDEFRNAVCRAVRPSVLPIQHPFLLELLSREVDYRQRLWEGLAQDPDDRYENLYRCAFLLSRLGRPEDVFVLWTAKHINMDVGTSLGAEYFIGAGLRPTLDFLSASGHPWADDITYYLKQAFVDGNGADDVSSWVMEQFRYHWPD